MPSPPCTTVNAICRFRTIRHINWDYPEHSSLRLATAFKLAQIVVVVVIAMEIVVMPVPPATVTVTGFPKLIIHSWVLDLHPHTARGALHPLPLLPQGGHVQDKAEEQTRKLLVEELEPASNICINVSPMLPIQLKQWHTLQEKWMSSTICSSLHLCHKHQLASSCVCKSPWISEFVCVITSGEARVLPGAFDNHMIE